MLVTGDKREKKKDNNRRTSDEQDDCYGEGHEDHEISCMNANDSF